MEKRGQLTIFIIAAIVIISIALFIFLIIRVPDNTTGINAERVNNFVDACIEQTGENAIYEIGQNGGYYFPPSASTTTGIPYYYLSKKKIMPSKARVENEISLFIKENLFFCTKNFVNFKDYNISQGNISVKTTIFGDKVVLNVNYPITTSQGEEISVIKDFQKEIPVRLGLIYDSIAKVMNSSEYGICLTCLYGVAAKNDLYVEMLDYDKNTMMIMFTDKNSQINREDYEYVYAVEN